ncbi:MAG: hypothetical protein SXQ77_07360, partial [Halobacteria archaeon]|nr:hypothetical protein [Halobacteria archaeon]
HARHRRPTQTRTARETTRTPVTTTHLTTVLRRKPSSTESSESDATLRFATYWYTTPETRRRGPNSIVGSPGLETDSSFQVEVSELLGLIFMKGKIGILAHNESYKRTRGQSREGE